MQHLPSVRSIPRRTFLHDALRTMGTMGAAGAAGAAGAMPLLARWGASSPLAHAADATAVVTLPTPESVLQTLRSGHPRLILLSDDVDRINTFIATDSVARSYRDTVVATGTQLLTQPPVKRTLNPADELLPISRQALERIYTLGLLYRLDGDRKWADRAITELRAVAGFVDWNPHHFLDVAELTHAFAIGYDWLYDVLMPADRDLVRTAIIEKGLMPAVQQYQTTAFWVNATHNWNNVCNGSVIVGALAVADEAPDLARTLLTTALGHLPLALASYVPDGAWVEGPAYWGYATKYTVAAFASLQSALGTDFGLSNMAGLAETGRFRLHSAGPNRLFFNYADAAEGAGDEPSLFWLGRQYADPLLASGARAAAASKGTARDLLWYDPAGTPDELARTAPDAHYVNANVACFRSSWTDPNALYLGFKGGDNGANHAHLDLGTFVLDALGQRWALDLGPDNYALPGYFGKERFTYYRLRTEGHNTLTVNDQNQAAKARAPIVVFGTSPDGGYAIADLSAGYTAAGVAHARRGVALRDARSRVLVQDEIDALTVMNVVWAMHTKAQITVGGDYATLTLGNATLIARILSPAGAVFITEEVAVPPPQNPIMGVRKLLVRLPATASARIAVLFTPGSTEGDAPTVTPLDVWPTPQPGQASGR